MPKKNRFWLLINPRYLLNKAPLFFAVLLLLNGIGSILVAILPFLKEAIHSQHVDAISALVSDELAWKVNSAVLLIIGYFLILIGRGIYKRQRLFWSLAVIMLSILLLNNVFIHERSSLLNVLYAVELIGLLIFYKQFDKQRKKIAISYAQFVVILSFVLALAYGIIGSFLIRDQFNGIHNWSDAIYFTVVTYSTVGYGDITPKTTDAQYFVISMIFFGLGAFAAVLTMVVGIVVERIKTVLQTFNKGRKHVKDHIIICGYTPFSTILIDQLSRQNKAFLLIDTQDNIGAEHEDLSHFLIQGEATNQNILNKANLAQATSIILAYNNDADNILALLTVKDIIEQKLKKPHILIKINQESNIDKAKFCGADEVISPLLMAADKVMGLL
ncbi:MAG: NAD-binding protein [Francisellaceae bacterium]